MTGILLRDIPPALYPISRRCQWGIGRELMVRDNRPSFSSGRFPISLALSRR